MPISIGSKTWKFCKSCDSLSRKKNKYCQYDIPEVNHKEIASRAFTIFKYGLISKEEYITIVEADLKCRGSPDVIDSHFKKPLNLDPITLEELGDFKYTFITPTGVCIHYNLQSFVYYLRTTQDFLDPVTRLPLERDDIERIHSMIQQHQPNLSIPSIIELYDKINKLKNINNDRENDNNNNNNNNVNNISDESDSDNEGINNDNNDNKLRHQKFVDVEVNAINEMSYFEDYPLHGCNQLIKKIKDIMKQKILKNYLENVTNHLKLKKDELNKKHDELGLPVGHNYKNRESKMKIMEIFIDEARRLIKKEWLSLLYKYEIRYIDPIQEELNSFCRDQKFSTRGEIHTYLINLKKLILEARESYYEKELEIWSNQIYQILSTTDSSFKMIRFTKENEIISDYAKSIVEKHHQKINEKIEKLLNEYLSDYSPCMQITSQPDTSTNSNSSKLSKTFNLKFDSKFIDSLVLLFSLSLTCFENLDEVFSQDNLRSILEDSSFIEDTRDERYGVLQELALIKIALRKLGDESEEEVEVEVEEEDDTGGDEETKEDFQYQKI